MRSRALLAMATASILLAAWGLGSERPRHALANEGTIARLTSDDIVQADRRRRQEIFAMLDAERNAVVDGLLRIGLEDGRDAEDRIAATLALARWPSDKTAAACLDHMDVKITKTRIGLDDDLEKERPFRVALRDMGIACVPTVLRWAGQRDRSAKELDDAAWILVRVLGPVRSPAIVAAWETGEPQRTRLRALGERLTGK